MKRLLPLIISFMLIFFSTDIFAGNSDKGNKTEASVEEKPDNSDLAARLKKVSGLPVKPKEVEDLSTKTVYKGTNLIFSAAKYKISLPKSEKKKEKLIAKYEKKGEYPYRICAYTLEQKSGAKKAKPTYKGKARLIVINAENKMILNKAIKMNKLCPT